MPPHRPRLSVAQILAWADSHHTGTPDAAHAPAVHGGDVQSAAAATPNPGQLGHLGRRDGGPDGQAETYA
jgi:hypothetical protein